MNKALPFLLAACLLPVTANAQWGDALNFASNEYTEASPLYWGSPPYDGDTVMTIECWVKWEGTTGNDQPIVYNGDISVEGYGIYLSNDKVEILMSNVDTLRSNVTLPLNVWTYLAAVRTGGHWILYVNGASQQITNSSNLPASPSLYFYVGANDDYSSQQYFNGDIDEVRISSVARYTTDFSSPSARFASDPETVALYHFDEGSGDTAHDASGNGNDLAIYGATWVTNDNPLAVQATDFLAVANGDMVKLSWRTQSEIDNAGFNILRRDQGATKFGLISGYANNSSLKGAGTSSTGRNYNFTDSHVISGATYEYKIQSASANGTTKDLSTLTVTVDVPKSYALYQNYPNPFNPSTTIRFDLKEESSVTLDLYNMLGQKVLEENYGTLNAGSFNEIVDLNKFSSGVYFYRISIVGSDGQKFEAMRKALLLK